MARWRLRFALLDASKWRRPAWPRNTLPVAVILKRFATAFFVLRLDIGFGIGSREPILFNQDRKGKLGRVGSESPALLGSRFLSELEDEGAPVEP